jgi:hypothetical protein
MFFKKSKVKKDKQESNEVQDYELLDLEDDILSETGGGTGAPNIGCGVQEDETNNG